MDVFIVSIICLALIGGLGYLWYKGFKGSVKNQQAKNANKAKYNPKYTGQMKHINGLPLPQGVVIDLFYCEDKIIFKKDNQEISISKDKITSIETVTGKDIDTSGAVAGYLVFGLAGAVLGASTVYMLITYESEGEQKGITLDTYMSGFAPGKIVNDFKNSRTNTEVKQIEL